MPPSSRHHITSRNLSQRRTIMPCRLVVLARYFFSSSLSEEHSLPSSPQTAPPQSSLTLAPDLVIPKRLHVQQLADEGRDDVLAEDGDEEPLLRELRDEVRDGTSEPLSLSLSESIRALPSRLARRSTEDALYCSRVIVRVSCGRLGRGHSIFEGESERPLGMCSLVRRECLLLEWPCDREDGAGAEGVGDFPGGMSKMLSLRPVVGSVVDSRAGSWETW